MGGFLGNLFRTYGPRALGSLAGYASAKIAEKTGFAVDPATLIGIGVTAYSAVHRITSSKVNPGDSAEGRIAVAQKKAVDVGTTVVVPPKDSGI